MKLTTRQILSMDEDSLDGLTGTEKIKNKWQHRQERDKMTKIESYSKIFTLGKSEAVQIFDGPVVVQEKVDGSQISFGKIDGQLVCRSKGKQINLDAPDGLFNKAVEVLKTIKGNLPEDIIFRGEYLSKPKHNALAYDRIPKNHIIIYDIQLERNSFCEYRDVVTVAEKFGFETVPLLYQGMVKSKEELTMLLEKTSVLGGQKIEGIVCKNYKKLNRDGKVLMGKWVSDSFKEVRKDGSKKKNIGRKEFIEAIGQSVRTQARWNKAIMHAKEDGTLTNSPRDIGLLIKMIQKDIVKEEEVEIREKLWKYASPKILRRAVTGFAEFYQQLLLEELQIGDKE